MTGPAPKLASDDLHLTLGAPVRTRFERFEFKYWLPPEVARAAVEYSAPYLVADATGLAAGGGQRNTSLYFDSSELEFFHNHVNKQLHRFKLRVRVYGDPLCGPYFFEVKRKVKSVTVKSRAVVPRANALRILSGDLAELPPLSPKQLRHLESFLYLLAVHRAEPRVLVRCDRAAYTAIDPTEDVRLTIDSNIAYQPARGLDFAGDPTAFIPIDGANQHGETTPRVLLELKFCGTAPSWMEVLVERLGLWRGGYSKYTSAIKHELSGQEREAFWCSGS